MGEGGVKLGWFKSLVKLVYLSIFIIAVLRNVIFDHTLSLVSLDSVDILNVVRLDNNYD